MYLGGDLVLETVDAILDGSVKPVPQEKFDPAGNGIAPGAENYLKRPAV